MMPKVECKKKFWGQILLAERLSLFSSPKAQLCWTKWEAEPFFRKENAQKGDAWFSNPNQPARMRKARPKVQQSSVRSTGWQSRAQALCQTLISATAYKPCHGVKKQESPRDCSVAGHNHSTSSGGLGDPLLMLYFCHFWGTDKLFCTWHNLCQHFVSSRVRHHGRVSTVLVIFLA